MLMVSLFERGDGVLKVANAILTLLNRTSQLSAIQMPLECLLAVR